MEASQPLIKNLDDIAARVRRRECILFLGAMASAAAPDGSAYAYTDNPPNGTQLSQTLARLCAYPYDDTWNLLRVALYFEITNSRSKLVQTIEQYITRREPGANGRPEPVVYQPSPALKMLAALPFPIVITTNYDRLFDRALKRAQTLEGDEKDPIVRVYRPNTKPDYVSLDPSEAAPILLKLHGDIKEPDSIVVTEEDYLCFIQKMGDENEHPIHTHIRARINTWPVLFIGYSLRDYNLRLLFRTMRWYLDAAALPLSYSVDPLPDQLIMQVFNNMVSFVENDLWNFVPALYEAVMGQPYTS